MEALGLFFFFFFFSKIQVLKVPDKHPPNSYFVILAPRQLAIA